MDENGNVFCEKEITTSGKDPARMTDLLEKILKEIDAVTPPRKSIFSSIAIEGFGFASNRGFLLGGIGWGIRCALYREGMDYIEVAPAALKKFTGGKGNAPKDVVRLEVYKRWGYEHKSDNVIDAYVLAQIARHIDRHIPLTKYQEEVIHKIQGNVKING